MSATLEEVIRKHVLKNAFDYGKAEQSGVVGKVIAELPDSKKNMKVTMQLVGKIISEVNKLPKTEVEKQMTAFTYVEKKEEEKKLELPNVTGKVVTRFLPEPNGHPHIGHAKSAFLSMECAKTYGGEFFIRWDDTNPEAEKIEYVDAIRSYLKWLGVEFTKESYTSDFIPEIYKRVEQLLNQKDAYVCQCSQEEIAKGRETGIACKCRSNEVKENLRLWKDIVSGKIAEGKAILRLMGDLKALNTVMRDPALLRILKTPHYRCGTKYSAWPNYDLSVCIVDSMQGVTHALRSKEYELRDELYYTILDRLKMRKPVVYDFSRLNLKGTKLSKRFILPLVKDGKVSGWDDPRLPTLPGLLRRGMQSAAIKKFVLSFGLSKVESNPTWDQLLSFNRKELESSPHFFFVPDPVQVKVLGKKIKYYLTNDDVDSLKIGEIFRFKGGFNVKVTKKTAKSISGENAGHDLIDNTKKLQWVDATGVNCKMYVPGQLLNDDETFNENSMQVRVGLCQNECANLKVGDIVQFERIGFARLDKKEKDKLEFVFSC